MRFGNKLFLPIFFSLVSGAGYYLITISLGSQIALLSSFLFITISAFLTGSIAGLAVTLTTAVLAYSDLLKSAALAPGQSIEIVILAFAGLMVSGMGGKMHQASRESRKSVLRVERNQKGFKEAEERFHIALAAAHAGIYRLDLKLGTAFRNASLNKIFGLQDREALFPISDFVMRIHAEDQDRVAASIQRMLDQKSSFSEQYRVYRADGSIVWIKDRGRALVDEEGTVEAVTGTMVDITDLVLAEELLHRSQEQFRVLIESIKDYGIFLLDMEGNVVSWNIGAERITGFTDTEAIGTHLDTIFASRDNQNEGIVSELREAKGKGIWQGERWHSRKNGCQFLAQEVVYPLQKSGQVYGFAKVIGDITLRKKNEDSIKHSEARFRLLLEAIPQMVWSANPDFSFAYANQRWLDYAGMSEEEIAKDGWQVLFDQEDSRKLKSTWLEASVNKSAFSCEIRIRRADSTQRWHLCLALPILDANGDISEWFGTYTDIEEQKQAQSELIAAKQEAEEVSQLKSAFLATVSHEIRTPLSAIIGFSRLLVEESWPEEKMREFASISLRNGYSLARIIDDILDLSKVEAGKLEVAKTEISIHDLVEEVIESLSVKAMEKSIGIRCKIDEDIPDLVLSDSTRLRQILVNIIGNAIKFTIEGEVAVEVKAENEDQRKLAIYVTDTGCGISPQNAIFLFQPFVQADTSTSRKYGGTGLGLTLSRKLAQLLGGNVTLVASKPQTGSTFKIEIPLVTQSAIENVQKSSPKKLELAPKTQPVLGRLKGLRILVAEDAVDTQLLLRQILQRQGAELDFADNGKQAIECAESKEYDIILMDIQMPICDGYQATRTLRSKAYSKPIIGLSAHAMREEHDKIIASGCNEHLAKPFDPKKLVDLIASLSSEVPKTKNLA